jgi:uncharacterized protein
MGKLSILLVVLWIAGVQALAQPSRREVIRTTTPEQDMKPNSPNVPDVYAVNGQFDHIVVIRFKYQTDLLAGLEKFVQEQKVRNAVILAGAGSLRGYHVHSVSNRTFPSKNIFIRDPAAPSDLVGMSGYIIEGRVHAHVALAYDDKFWGGHLEPGCEVFTFAAVTLGVFRDGVDLSKLDDKNYR